MLLVAELQEEKKTPTVASTFLNCQLQWRVKASVNVFLWRVKKSFRVLIWILGQVCKWQVLVISRTQVNTEKSNHLLMVFQCSQPQMLEVTCQSPFAYLSYSVLSETQLSVISWNCHYLHKLNKVASLVLAWHPNCIVLLRKTEHALRPTHSVIFYYTDQKKEYFYTD